MLSKTLDSSRLCIIDGLTRLTELIRYNGSGISLKVKDKYLVLVIRQQGFDREKRRLHSLPGKQRGFSVTLHGNGWC